MIEEAFGQLLYRSQALRPLSRRDLRVLLTQARERNARESLTGLLVHDDGHFWQWLEGPADALSRVWSSIARDPRHHRVERLPTPWRSSRLFPDWRMQLAVAGAVPAGDGWSVEEDILKQLHRPATRAAAVIEGIGLTAVMPDAASLAQLLARGTPAEVDAAFARVSDAHPSLEALWLHLVKPVSAALGDAWMTDALDSTDLVVAYGHLLGLMRATSAAAWPSGPSTPQRLALVAPLPGEHEFAGASFAGIALHAQGWHVACAFPADSAALEAALSGKHFDVLHLAISDTFGREHRLAELAATIRALRRASANPMLQVLVSGRAFSKQPGLSTLVGADGDGLHQGSTPADLEATLTWARVRPHSVAAMVAQATINDVVLNIQRQRFGIPEEAGLATPATRGGR